MTWMARSSRCVPPARRACARRAEQYPDGSTVDILGVLRIYQLRAAGFGLCFLPGVSAAARSSAGAAFSTSGSTRTYWRPGRGEPRGSTILCIISRSPWAGAEAELRLLAVEAVAIGPEAVVVVDDAQEKALAVGVAAFGRGEPLQGAQGQLRHGRSLVLRSPGTGISRGSSRVERHIGQKFCGSQGNLWHAFC
jgi:hypothetical protein